MDSVLHTHNCKPTFCPTLYVFDLDGLYKSFVMDREERRLCKSHSLLGSTFHNVFFGCCALERGVGGVDCGCSERHWSQDGEPQPAGQCSG